MPNDYLFTWKTDKWPYEKLRALVDNFEAGLEVTEPWRCSAHKQIKGGDSAYFFKQGRPPRGIFCVGTISGVAFENPKADDGENRWQVPVAFRALVDPTKELLVSEEQLLALPAPSHRWNTQASGVTLEYAAARAIDREIATSLSNVLLASGEGTDEIFDPRDIVDARERVKRSIMLRRGQKAFREKLLVAYGRKCTVTGCDIEDLLEAAHIAPYKGIETNHIQNGLLLRSDIHTLFDCGLIAIDPENLTLLLCPQLAQSSYRKLAGKSIRIPKQAEYAPSAAALRAHRRRLGW